MKKFFILLTFGLFSCLNELPTVPDFSFDLNQLNLNASALDDSVKIKMNGIYKVQKGTELLGNEIVGKWVGQRWCMYSTHDVVYSENKCGSLGDSSIVFKGYVRIVRSGSGTRIDLNIHPSQGGRDLLKNNSLVEMIITGKTSAGTEIALSRIRNLYQPENTTKKFHILGHRGGGRNAERLGISENSIEMIKHSQILGATGVEIDVKRTRDRKIILFHDNTFSPRTVNGAYLLGNVENFDFDQIQTFGRLYYGEVIPTLEDALKIIIEETSLSLVWIDVKDPDIVEDVMNIQKSAIELASLFGRNLKILLGISEEEIFNVYERSNLDKTPVLIEHNSQVALSYDPCLVWAPRWTSNVSEEQIRSFHNINKLVFTWTVDIRDFIEEYINENQFDGILSNYPSQVAGIYYSQQ